MVVSQNHCTLDDNIKTDRTSLQNELGSESNRVDFENSIMHRTNQERLKTGSYGIGSEMREFSTGLVSPRD